LHTQLITWTFDLARPSFGTIWAKLQLFKRRRLQPAKNTNKAIRQGARIQNSRESLVSFPWHHRKIPAVRSRD
jgi:hypothetical protein